jgi:hypothetical protein
MRSFYVLSMQPNVQRYKWTTLFLEGGGGRNTGTWPHESLGLRSVKGCADDARQKLKTTDPTSRQRGRPTSTNPQLSKNTWREKGKNWSRVADGCLTPRKTSPLTVGHSITLTLSFLLSCHDMRTKNHRDWYMQLNTNREVHRHTQRGWRWR